MTTAKISRNQNQIAKICASLKILNASMRSAIKLRDKIAQEAIEMLSDLTEQQRLLGGELAQYQQNRALYLSKIANRRGRIRDLQTEKANISVRSNPDRLNEIEREIFSLKDEIYDFQEQIQTSLQWGVDAAKHTEPDLAGSIDGRLKDATHEIWTIQQQIIQYQQSLMILES